MIRNNRNLRKRLIIFLSMILMLSGTLVFTACGNNTKEKTIRVGTNAEFPPFEYMDNNGKPTGFDVALIKAIGDEIGYNVEVVNMEFKSLLGSIQTGGIDCAIAGMTVTDERKQSVDFTDTYYEAVQSIILPKASDVASVEDLNGKSIAVQEGTTGDFLVTPGEDNEVITDESTNVKRFKKGTDAVLELLNGGVDAVVIDTKPAENFVKSNSGKLKMINDDTSIENYAIAVGKGNTKMLDLLNKGMTKIKENGTYDNLVSVYIENSDNALRKTSDNIFVNLGYTFKFVFIDNNGWMMLVKGLGITLLISLCAVVLGVILGFIVALMRLTELRKGRKTILSRIAGIYIDVLRGTPVVVQLLIMYMIIFHNSFGIVAAICTFGINSGAYVAEIIRAGIMAVDNGQMEGGRSLGLSYGETMRYIIIPQAVKNILPTLCNEFIALIKETSIVGYVAVQDLTKASDFIVSRTYETFMPLIMVAIIYYVVVKVLTKLFARFERRLRKSDNH